MKGKNSMTSVWSGSTFSALGYDITVYKPTACKTFRLTIYPHGSEDCLFSEYFASEKEAKEFGINFIVEEVRDLLAEFGYNVVKRNADEQ